MIKAEKVIKKFDDFTALSELSCEIPEGCIYGLVGSNGAGKSTFLRLIAGVYKEDGGVLTVDEQKVWENTSLKNQILFVPDDLYFLPGASMQRMADLYQTIYKEFDRKRFEKLAGQFQLPYKKSIQTFSKGMKRQAATLLAICSKPKYLLMDETFDGLDPVMRGLVKRLICENVIENKTTAILSSHSLRELEDTCDQLALLHKGGVVLESDIGNLKTSLFKVQVAFIDEYSQEKFEGIHLMHYVKRGSVANMIVKGDREEVIGRIQAMNPVLLDVLPLTLEEVFTYEMEALGYAFNDVLTDDSQESAKEGGMGYEK